jgi:8-amino-7-oxononanoate synthase
MDVFAKAFEWKEARVARLSGLYPFFKPISENQGTEVVIEGRRTIMVGANSYLSLSTHPKVKAAAAEAALRYGASCCGSRFANGTLEIHEELERRLAIFLKKESALCFTTGFTTNMGSIAALLGRHDIAFVDRGDHACLMDGTQLTYADVLKYKHNDMADLEKKLQQADADAGKLLITDGVFSMEGDLADLPGIVELKRKYGFRIMVDDAHGLGVMGHGGRGTGEHFGLHDEVDVITGTFSKSFGSIGGVVAGQREVVDWIKHRARSMIFAASMSPPTVAAALASLEIVEHEPERRERLWQIASKMRSAFQAMGFNTGVSVTPIIPILVGEQMKTFNLWKSLLEAGVFTNAVIPPAVEPGRSMLRTSYQAAHTDEQLDRVLDVFETIGKRLKIVERRRPATTERITIALHQPEGLHSHLEGVMPHPMTNGNGHANGHANGHSNGKTAPRWTNWVELANTVSRPRLTQLRERLDAAWSLAGWRPPGLPPLDLDQLQARGQATLERVRDAMEAVTYRAANLNPTELKEMPRKIMARARGLNGQARE